MPVVLCPVVFYLSVCLVFWSVGSVGRLGRHRPGCLSRQFGDRAWPKNEYLFSDFIFTQPARLSSFKNEPAHNVAQCHAHRHKLIPKIRERKSASSGAGVRRFVRGGPAVGPALRPRPCGQRVDSVLTRGRGGDRVPRVGRREAPAMGGNVPSARSTRPVPQFDSRWAGHGGPRPPSQATRVLKQSG